MNESNQDIKSFVTWLNELSPLEFTTLAVFTGYVLACNLTTSEQNSIGNWFELLGQIILTFNAQGSINNYSLTNKQYKQIIDRINKLYEIINSNNY